MPSQAEIEEHQQDIEELSAVAVAEVAALVMAMSGDGDEDKQSLVDAVPVALERYMVSAGVLAANWYRGLARERPRAPEAEPTAVAPIVGPTDRISLLDAQDFQPRPAELPPREQIESTVWWALSEPTEPEPVGAEELEPEDTSSDQAEPAETAEEEPRARVLPAEESAHARVIPAEATEQQARVISRLAGATQRYVTGAARDTVTQNATAEGVRWARHAQPEACAFCRLLATRGPDYLTKESASIVGASGRVRGSRKKGESYHDDCACVPVPVRAGDAYQPPEYVGNWTAQYEAAYEAAGGNYKKILAAMRAAEKSQGGSTH